MFTKEDIENHIRQVTDAYTNGEEVPNAPPNPDAKPVETKDIGTGKDVMPWIPIDIYQHGQRKLYDESQKRRPKGSSAVVMAATKAIIDGALSRKYKQYKSDIESLMSKGDRQRAQLLQSQYMQEEFLPAVEAVINYSSPDELVNCKEALSALDDLAMGVGRMSGYTASYVRKAYEQAMGQKQGESDPAVVAEIRRIRGLVDDDQMRTAIGLATRLKSQIDKGEHLASDDDYALLGRMVAYAN